MSQSLPSFVNKAIHDNPPIPFEELLPLIEKAQAGSKPAMDRVVLSFMRLVRQQAGKFARWIDADELISEGVLGLMHAVKLFDTKRKLKLSTYAVWWVRAYMIRAVQQTTGYRNQTGTRSSVTGIPADKRVSLSAPVSDEGEMTWEDMLVANGPSPEEETAKNEYGREIFREAEKFCITTKERMLLRRLATGKELTLQKCGATFGITRERMRQIEKRLKSKLARSSQLRRFA